ncbi:DUF4145 domain-containing protein [Pyxidicoccus parkwayensis]|uniref:DUF4145 domain-containing protein n=1 Tax=Pyxidicoccus parkwayensis TaxID=2813578 RepID=A0ABX7NZI0_9BACT|nr:DUF4145 domain-containing protein [Pyxidicoccus parkwaysis]QSQ24327.1 DUF4145 domain-containing protein [Pyxidicoccus parkwaysis]
MSEIEDPDDYPTPEQQEEEEHDREEYKEGLLRYGMAPALFVMKCGECDTGFTAVVYNGASGESLAVFPDVAGGIATPKTPESVGYYLDQAARAQSVDAMSAAATMYRAALEHLLEEQGISGGMLGPRLEALLRKREANDKSIPEWVYRINPEYLTVIKDLGNGAVHTNKGDVSLQGHINSSIVVLIQTAFESLLEHVYEAPARETEHLTKLRAAAAAVTPPKKAKG